MGCAWGKRRVLWGEGGAVGGVGERRGGALIVPVAGLTARGAVAAAPSRRAHAALPRAALPVPVLAARAAAALALPAAHPADLSARGEPPLCLPANRTASHSELPPSSASKGSNPPPSSQRPYPLTTRTQPAHIHTHR